MAHDLVAAPPRATPTYLASGVLLLGTVSLLGWAFHNPTMQSVVPGMANMKVNTAAGLILLAMVLIGLDRPWWVWRAVVMTGLIAVAAISLATLAEYVLGVKLRIDELVVGDPDATRFPGRTSPATAVALLGLAIAYLMLHVRRWVGAAQVLLLILLVTPTTTLAGYLYGVPGLHRAAPLPTVAPNTSAALVMLCVGGFYVRANDRLIGVITSSSLAGSVVRRLLPAAIGLPLLIGLAVMTGERSGLFTAGFGSALLVSCCVVFFGGAVCWTATLVSNTELARHSAERERSRSERNVSEGEVRLRIAVETGRLGSWELDLTTGEVDCSEQYRANFGLDPSAPCTSAQLLGMIHPEDRERVQVMLDRAVADRTDYNADYRVVWADGSLHWLMASGRALYGEDGRAARVVGVSLDRTAERAAAADRERLLEVERAARVENERAGRMKDEFLATLSHELRTPLNAILGWSQIIRSSNNDPEDVSQGMEVIERNARAQSQIIEDLLDMSRIISGKVRLDVQRLDLAAITQASVATVRPTAEAKGVRLLSVIDPLHDVVVTGDTNRLQQVLWNLLTNAIKFTPKGGRVQVLLERVNSHLEISVIDTGEGIRPEFLPYVFDRFRQADASTTRRHGGLGLGLSIVKQLVELHGGSVRVKSAGLGHGTTFIVSLPLTVAHPSEEEVERRHPTAAPTLAGLKESCVQIEGVRVLVIDDEPDARVLMRRLLEDFEAVVAVTDSADEAVRLIATKQFDVLVSDIGMPVEDGYSLIKRVRALGKEKGGDIPAIALTAYARAEDRVRAVSAGFQMHVSKPVEGVELVTMVAGAAGRTGQA